MKWSVILVLLVAVSITAAPTLANDQITYVSHPDELAIFLNDIAFARDTITLAGSRNSVERPHANHSRIADAEIFSCVIASGQTLPAGSSNS